MNGITLNTALANTSLAGARQNNSAGDNIPPASIPAASNVSISSQARELAEAEESAKTVPATHQPGGKGYQIMLDRLFGGREPPVASATPVTMNSLARPGHVFLTKEDRALVADMYEYAQSQGADLKYVDEIAYTLGGYRQFNDGKVMISFNSGGHYDSQGRQLSVSFDGEMAAVADRILDGMAISSTRFDRGFLNFQFDPGHGALPSAYDPAFLEHMVNHFSSESGRQEPLDSRFSVYVPPEIESHYVIHASEEVRLPPWEPDIIMINGEYFITERGRANGITIEDVHGNKQSHSQLNEISNESLLFFLDATFGQNAAKRPYWVNAFFEKMGLGNDPGIQMLAWK